MSGLFDEAKALARRSGRPQDAVAFIERAAAQGDAEGNLIVAHWYLYGSDRPRDFDSAHRHLERAADKGSNHAVRILANLIANGLGAEADAAKAMEMLGSVADADAAAAAELDLLQRMRNTDEAMAAERERLSSDPSIEIVRKLLTAEECVYVMGLAEPSLRPSFVYDPQTGEGKPDPIRRSDGAALLPHDEDLVVQGLNRRLALATGTGVDQREALYVIRYRPGQEYRPHFDALPGLHNQRAWTAITYFFERRFRGRRDRVPGIVDFSAARRRRRADLPQHRPGKPARSAHAPCRGAGYSRREMDRHPLDTRAAARPLRPRLGFNADLLACFRVGQQPFDDRRGRRLPAA